MSESTFTFRVDDTLKLAFADVAKQQDRTAAQLLRDFMRSYVVENKADLEYDAWFRRKVEEGRRAVKEGRVLSNEEVEIRAKERRTAILEGKIAR